MQRDRLLSVGQRGIVEAGTGHLRSRLGMKRDAVVLLPEADPLAGTRDLDPVAGVGLELGAELEGARVLHHHRVGHRGCDLKAVLDRGDIHVLAEGQDDRGTANHGPIAVGDTCADGQRRGQRPQDQPGCNQQQDDGKHPPATT